MTAPRRIRCYECTSEYELDLPKCPRCGLPTHLSEGYELTDNGHRVGSRRLMLVFLIGSALTTATCAYALLG